MSSSGPNNQHPLVQVMSASGIPHVSGQLQNMQISTSPITSVGGAGSMIDSSMMMDPLMVPISMAGVGNLDPQLQPSDPPFSISPAVSQSSVTIPQYSTDFGHGVTGSTSLTEFTKRRNWSQRVLEELQDFLHILTPEMKIVYASPSGKALTGYETDELLGRVMTDFIHTDDSGLFIREFHESAATGHTLRMFYRFKKKDNTYTVLETHGHPHFSSPQGGLGGSVGPKGFFMMARQYPTKNAALLDSFLEYKIEHERLTRRITELQKEESEDQQAQLRQREAQIQQQIKNSQIASSISQETSSTISHNATPDTMAPPAKPGLSNTLLTRQNLELIDASNPSRADNIRDKMMRFGDGTHMEGIELLTGLRYREGERSRGISTGDTSPSLIRGDVGVPIPIDKESRHTSEKKKKQKTADEYVCTDCGTLDSPEWRKGPKGPKTLCNACGLRWAKKEKKKNANANANANATSNTNANTNSNVSTQSSPIGPSQNGVLNSMATGN